MVARYYPRTTTSRCSRPKRRWTRCPGIIGSPTSSRAKPRLGEAIRLVETVLARNAEHPQAPHLYIHLMENGPDPKRAEAAADRLSAPLAGDAGHLVHMPAHIYYRLGRWKDSIRVNIDAARKDEAYIKEFGRQGLRPLRLLSAQRPLHRHVGADGRRPADRDQRSQAAGGDRRCRHRDAARLGPGDLRRALFRDAAVRLGGRGAGTAGARPAPRLCARHPPLCPRRRLCPAEQPARLRCGAARAKRDSAGRTR